MYDDKCVRCAYSNEPETAPGATGATEYTCKQFSNFSVTNKTKRTAVELCTGTTVWHWIGLRGQSTQLN